MDLLDLAQPESPPVLGLPEPRWVLPEASPGAEAGRLARETGLPLPLATLLTRRGFLAPEQIDRFLDPKLRHLSDPFLLPDMHRAVSRIFQALDRSERIALYGDYDVDGVTSLALIQRTLQAYGAQVCTFLPHRIEEGYGLSADGIARCRSEHQPHLLIAIDCGTSSAREIARLQEAGIDVIVLDHHECTAALPECVAVVNPKRGDDFRYLCSAGLAFKLAHALLKTRRLESFDLKAHLDLVALGTVADIVPLIDENRILAHAGACRLASSVSPGLRALCEVASVSAPIRGEDIGFKLGPRLNAAGRLDSAERALQLLLAADTRDALPLARELDLRNRERREVERKTFVEADMQAAKVFDPARDFAIVLGSAGWHPGVLGIVASRIMRKYYRPTFVIGFDEAGLGKGSGRSIEGISLVRALEGCAEHLDRFGGHEMAAGLALPSDRLDAFRRAFNRCVGGLVSSGMLQPQIRLDCELSFRDLHDELLAGHERLHPFGPGNPQPLFCARGVQPVAAPVVLKEKHLRFRLRQNGASTDAIYFNGASGRLPRPPWDVAFYIEPNTYQGVTRLQVQIQAIRSSE